jgi:hypothetical protein
MPNSESGTENIITCSLFPGGQCKLAGEKDPEICTVERKMKTPCRGERATLTGDQEEHHRVCGFQLYPDYSHSNSHLKSKSLNFVEVLVSWKCSKYSKQ